MEHALILGPSGPEPDDKALAKADILYVGDEFCEARLLSTAALRRAARRHPGKRLALLTPILTQTGLRAAIRAAEAGLAEGVCDEVIVNDIGLLNYLAALRGRRPRLTLGRVLVQSLQHSLKSHYFLAFMRNAEINSFEYDSAETCGYLPKGPGFRYHLHVPYLYLAHSRFCRLTGGFCSECRQLCALRTQPLGSPVVKKMFVRGNACLQFNPGKSARALRAAGPGRVSRLVVTA